MFGKIEIITASVSVRKHIGNIKLISGKHSRAVFSYRGWFSPGMLLHEIYKKTCTQCKYNDTYNLENCNEILKKVSDTVADNLRPFDTLGKWSELEFAAIAINVDDDKLTLIGERIRTLIEKITIPVGKGSIKLALSIGASIATENDTSDILMSRVKSHLEHSIKKGGNCITIKISP